LNSAREGAVRSRIGRETTVSKLAGPLPIARRLWLSSAAYQYRRAHGILRRGEAGVFALRESHADAISSDASVYTLRDSGLRLALRHGSVDGLVLEEIFRQQCYALPEHARASLARLERPPRILDLGGHIGLFALYVFGLYPEAEITSVEPDPVNLRLLEACFRLNAGKVEWTIVRACAGVDDGTATFVSCDPSHGDFARSHVTASPQPGQSEVPVRDVFPLMERVDLVKFDIEGSEWQILQDPRFGRTAPPLVVLEYHPYRCPEKDALSCVTRLLIEAGYEIGPHAGSSGGEGILWAWSRSNDDAT